MKTTSEVRTWVLLHGTPLTPHIWDETADQLDAVVLKPDCTAIPSGPHAQSTLAARLAAAIDGDIDLVGHSFGGQVAIELALLAPERVRSLTIMCSRDTPYPPFASVADSVRAGTVPTAAATLERWFSPDELASGGPVVEEVTNELENASVADWAAALEAISTYDSSDRTPTLRMPVTLLAAGADTVSTPEAMRQMHDRIPHSRLEVHEAWHHLSPFLNPRILSELLTENAARR
jgi:pimeloyl-ACP methyl ester carboxylesterase